MEIADHVGEFAESLADTGMRLVLADNFNDVNPARIREGAFEFDAGRREEGLQRSADLVERWHGRNDGQVTCFLAPHAPELCSPELLRAVRAMAEARDIGYTIHLSQSRLEVRR